MASLYEALSASHRHGQAPLSRRGRPVGVDCVWGGNGVGHRVGRRHRPGDDGTVQVTTTYRAGASGEFYIEGAMVDIVLRDAAGEVIGHEAAAPGEPITFSDLPTGTYVIAPALRPCDGNCGALDARTDGCHDPVDVAGDLRIHVSFRVSAPCTIATPKA